MKRFEVIGTIKLGMTEGRLLQPQHADYWRLMLRQAKIAGSYCSPDSVLSNPSFTIGHTIAWVDLVAPTLAELGLSNGALLRLVYSHAQSLGLKLCPWEAGPLHRIAYMDQPVGEKLTMALETIPGDTNFPLFDIGCDESGLYLHGYSAFPGNPRGAQERFIFMQDCTELKCVVVEREPRKMAA